MRWILCGLMFWTTVALAVPVEDDLDRMIKERGLINQITDQLSQQISQQLEGTVDNFFKQIEASIKVVEA